MKIGKYIIILFALAVFLLAIESCKREDPLPHNPYDDVDYGPIGGSSYTPDPNGIVGIYENILRKKCSLPGCHDGHFEPDYRSIQSAWSTMVYHKIVKNTADSSYIYRVTPGDTGASIFWHRINRGDAQLQQMPATGQYLTSSELENVKNWILGGAKDMFGNVPTLPNNEPRVLGYIAFDQSFSTQLDVVENRLDSVPYHPFKVNQNTVFNVVFLVEDDSTSVSQLQVNRLKMSLDKNNFVGAQSVNAYFLGSGVNVWVASLNSSVFSPSDTVYMRYYVNDGMHSQDTEFPRDDNDDAYKTYAAFYIKP